MIFAFIVFFRRKHKRILNLSSFFNQWLFGLEFDVMIKGYYNKIPVKSQIMIIVVFRSFATLALLLSSCINF